MEYAVWWVTDRGFGLEATFAMEGLAHVFADMMNSKAAKGGAWHEVTKVGETPESAKEKG